MNCQPPAAVAAARRPLSLRPPKLFDTPALRRRLTAIAIAAVALLLLRCVATPHGGREGFSIEVCDQPFDVDTRVVTFREPIGYDAYRRAKWFTTEAEPDDKLRYTPLRGDLPAAIAERAKANGLTLADLQQVVHLFVLHFDVCGTSRQCFKVLHDTRNLSVHFLLDVDGTIWQTLDLREKAHHASIANDASIGVEIAHPGCWPQPLSADMRRWYERDDIGWRMRVPPGIENGVLTEGFVARPARPELVSGEVHGKTWHQFDYTEAQYRALARLCAGLARVFPRIKLDAPRDGNGAVLTRVLTKNELLSFDGIVGHFHVNESKQDPGPAMQWDRLLSDARALR